MHHRPYRLPQQPTARIARVFHCGALAYAAGPALAVKGVAIAAALMAATAPTLVLAQAADTQTRDYSIPAGPLENALNRFGRETGILLSFTPETAEDLHSGGLQGRHSVQSGLNALLAGTGVQAIRQPNGSYLLVKSAAPPSPAPAASGPAATLQTVTVTAERFEEQATGPVGGLVARRSTLATKTDTPLLETPQTISVVSREQVELQDAQSVTRALEYTPGAVAAFGGTNSLFDVVQTRGFFARDHLDGLRLPFSAYSVAVPQFDPYMLERIELLQGPASVLFGQSSPGGVLNMVSRRPQTETAHEVLLQTGSHNRTQLAFDSTGAIGEDGKLFHRLTGLARQNDGQVDFSNEKRELIAPSFTWRPSADTSLTLLTHYQRDEQLPQYQAVPAAGSLRPNPNGPIPRTLMTGDPGWDHIARDQYGVGYALEHSINEGWTLRQNMRHTEVKVDSRALPGYMLAADNRTLMRVASASQAEGSIFAIDNQAQMRFSSGTWAHTLLMGLDYMRQHDDYRFASQLAPSIDLYAPVYGVTIPALIPRLSTRHTMEQTGLYVQDQMRSGRWVLTMGGRYDEADSNTANRQAGTSVRKSDGAFTWRMGVNHVYDNGLAPYASYSTSFEPLGGTDFTGAPFLPTEGRQLEAGIKYQPAGGSTQLSLSAYRLTQENVLTPDTTPGRASFSIQTGEVQSQGISAEARMRPLRNVDLVATYAYTDSQVTRANPSAPGVSLLGKPLSRTPRHLASLWLGYRFTQSSFKGFTAGLGVRHIGENYADTAITMKLPAVTLFDIALHYDFGASRRQMDVWRLSLGVSNLAGKDFISYCLNTTQCFYGQPRTTQVTLRKRW
ncbi:TonB-dependent siderophore receptor [Hydrogenophaga sp. BPS33]|uniref:TonB-dependent siderophore receptor n=1 Tax=Hydrogenophaga sp. BPS33 TaxID=2651974 RepID=UPI00131F48D9|nr:TonB-dependent siderophore receptor [Hydrogenophaga sp. BPS33]QHE87158.1 TonB-dependent siderophore receptor [Hydrogenophaga sp. BPS33]